MLGGKILPVCARCTGIYTGIFFAMLFLWHKNRLRGNKPHDTQTMLFAALAFIPIAIDGFFSYLGFWESNNIIRVITGALAGSVLPGLLLLGANYDIKGDNAIPVYSSLKAQLFVTAVTLIYGVLAVFGIGVYHISALFAALGVICFWADFLYLLIKNIFSNKKIPFWLLAFCGSILIIVIKGRLKG